MSFLVHKAQLTKDTFEGNVIYPILAILLESTLDEYAFVLSHKLYSFVRWNTCSWDFSLSEMQMYFNNFFSPFYSCIWELQIC